MAAEVLCGRCGMVLDSPASRCSNCGAGRFPAGISTPARNPYIAAALSAFVPGLGQIYAGHHLRGLGYLVGTLGLEFFGFDLDLTAVGAMIGIPMELGGAGLWLHGIFDAYRLAKSSN